MSANPTHRRGAAAVILAAALLAACSSDRALVLDPAGPPSYDAQLSNNPRGVPGGEVSIVAFDSTFTIDSTVTFTATPAPPTYRIVRQPTTTVNRAGVQVHLTGIDTLSTGFYTVWLSAAPEGPFTRATGRLEVVRTDTSFTTEGDPVATPVVTTTDNATFFQNGGTKTQVFFTVPLTPAEYDDYSMVLVTVEATNNASTPGTVQPFWSDEFAITPVVDTTITAFEELPSRGDTVVLQRDTAVFVGPEEILTGETFGVHFGAFDPAGSYEPLLVGRGIAGFRDNILVIDDSSLARPPEGYYYGATLLKRDELGRFAVDTIVLGPLTAPFPRRSVSLFNADVELVDPVVSANPPAILAASLRVDADTLGVFTGGTPPYSGFSELWITLESKFGPANVTSPTIVLSAGVPGPVATAANPAVSASRQ